MDCKSATDALAKAEPMRWKAVLFGAKMVTSRRPSTVLRRLVAFKAPYKEVRPAATRVADTF